MAGLQDELRQARAELEERGRMLVSAKQAIEKLQSELDDERAASGELQAQAAGALETQEQRIQELEADLARGGGGSYSDDQGAEANQLRESLMAVQLQLSGANEDLAKRHSQTIRLESQLREKTQTVASLQEQAAERQQQVDQANARADELESLVAEKDALMGEFIEATQALESEKQQFVAEATQARAELEQSSADRRELAGQLRALLEEKGRWDQERPRLEGSLAHERDGKEHFQQRVREQVELRLGVLQARVEELASRDTLLLGKLADAANQVGHARAAVEAETARRRDAEATLREATDLFKRELWEKQEELRGLATQLHQLRDWHGRFVEALGHDVRATARILSQPVAEAAYVQPRPTQPHHFSQPPATFSSSELSSQPEPSLQSRFAEAYRAAGLRPRLGDSAPSYGPAASAMMAVRPSAAAALLNLSQRPPEVEHELRRLRKIRHEYQAALAREDPLRAADKNRSRLRTDKPASTLFHSEEDKIWGRSWGGLTKAQDLSGNTGALLQGMSAVTGRELSIPSTSGAGWQANLLSRLGMAAVALDAKLGSL